MAHETLFIAVGAALLRRRGDFVFITPRSFVSGPYFRGQSGAWVSTSDQDLTLQIDALIKHGWRRLANSEPAAATPDTSVTQEMERIREAIRAGDQAALRKYGGLNPARRRHLEFGKLPMTKEADGGLIDGYATAIQPLSPLWLSLVFPESPCRTSRKGEDGSDPTFLPLARHEQMQHRTPMEHAPARRRGSLPSESKQALISR